MSPAVALIMTTKTFNYRIDGILFFYTYVTSHKDSDCILTLNKAQLHYPQVVGWLVVLRIYVALAVFQPYRDLEAGHNQSL